MHIKKPTKTKLPKRFLVFNRKVSELTHVKYLVEYFKLLCCKGLNQSKKRSHVG